MKATRECHSLPVADEDYEYYASYPSFTEFTAKMGQRITKRSVHFSTVGECWWLAVPGSYFYIQIICSLLVQIYVIVKAPLQLGTENAA